MNTGTDKVTDLADAVAGYVTDGCHLSIGGFTANRVPMAAVYEIIRKRIRNLHVYAHSNGQGVDELGRRRLCRTARDRLRGKRQIRPPPASGSEKRSRPAPSSSRTTPTNQMTLRFLAGAMGVPFLPTRSSLGTDIVAKWGFSTELRRADPRIPDRKLVVIDNPFEPWNDTDRVVLVPAITPDVTIIHAQQADARGNVKLQGLTFCRCGTGKGRRARDRHL